MTNKFSLSLTKLHTQFASFYFIASLLLIVMLSISLYYGISQIVLDEAIDTTKMTIEGSGKQIEGYLDKLKALSTLIVENHQTRMFIEKENESNRKQITKLIQTVLESEKGITSIVIVSKDGRIISNEENLDMKVSEDMIKEEWYANALNSKGMPVLTSARRQEFSMDQDQWVIAISQEVTNSQGENMGVVLIDINYQIIESYLKDINLGSKGFNYIINVSGEVVYHKDTSYFIEEVKRQQLVAICEMENGYDAYMDKLTHHYPLENTDWILVGVSSLDGLNRIKKQIAEVLVTVSLLLLIIVFGSGIFFAGRLTRPIKKLEEAMQDLEGGLKNVKVDNNGCYEVQSLSMHYNRMVRRIQELMDEITRKEAYLRKSEISTLYSQINPHFLYNTLDTIVWMAEFNDSKKVIEVTKALASFFRISLSQGEDLIPLRDEIDHIKYYLFIQKQRYMEQLSYTIDVDETLFEKMVPKIILQPIVENAIYHGIRGLDKRGEVGIYVKKGEQGIIITIEDNGKGFDKKKADDKNKELNMKLGGIGLKNVDERIKLFYGEEFGVCIESEEGKGTKVQIILGSNIK